jgi:hypothetical protein
MTLRKLANTHLTVGGRNEDEFIEVKGVEEETTSEI